jgi:zinc transporter ZupT
MVLTVLAAVAAMVTIGGFPTGHAVYLENDGGRVLIDSSQSILGWATLIAMSVTGILAVVAIGLHFAGRRRAAERTLLATGIFGLAGLVPGVLALAARQLSRRPKDAA